MRHEHTRDDNFSCTMGDIASNNRLSVKANLIAASGTAITLTVVFLILLILAAITYLVIAHMTLLDIVVTALFIGGFLLLVFKAVNYSIREAAKTRALLIHYNAQPLRDNLIEAKSGLVVLYDPHERYRVENASTVAETYHINEKPQAPITEFPEGRRPTRLSQLLSKESEHDYATHS
jgi:Ca2+/Na+ antiporter